MSEVLSEAEVLTIVCPVCSQGRGKGCLDNNRHVLASNIDQMGLSFHNKRIIAAQEMKSRRTLGKLGATEKALITYYAFIALCNSCSTKSTLLFGKEFTTEQVQMFFVEQAIKELKADGLLTNNFTPTYVKPS